MPTETEIKAELDNVLDDVLGLLELCGDPKDIVEFGAKYQSWYSRATKLIELLGKDRVDEFRSYYLIDSKRKSFDASMYVIQDYIKGILASIDIYKTPQWDVHNILRIRINTQAQILQSLESRIGTILSDVRGHLLAEIEDED